MKKLGQIILTEIFRKFCNRSYHFTTQTVANQLLKLDSLDYQVFDNLAKFRKIIWNWPVVTANFMFEILVKIILFLKFEPQVSKQHKWREYVYVHYNTHICVFFVQKTAKNGARAAGTKKWLKTGFFDSRNDARVHQTFGKISKCF